MILFPEKLKTGDLIMPFEEGAAKAERSTHGRLASEASGTMGGHTGLILRDALLRRAPQDEGLRVIEGRGVLIVFV